MKETILIVDDEADMLENVRRVLERQGYRCVTLDEPSRFSQVFAEESPALVLTDLKMPGKDGLEILKEAKAANPDAFVILITAFATVETAVAAIREGALDYLAKPFSNDQLLMAVEKAFREKRLKEENLKLRQKLGVLYGMEKIMGTSSPLRRVLELVRKIASTDTNILITGESGTGKEMIARVIHMNSRRKDGPFVPVDCASLPENLLESELFGHEKGAFTDALTQRPGLFEYAQGGTIFLDEIGDMPLSLQAKLFRVLQERQVRRLGGNRMIGVDVRVVSATNKDLAKEVESKRFREELFFRLNVINIELPPLRSREGDVPLLARHFLEQFNRSNHKKIRGIAAQAVKILEGYAWPGNVRELQNVIERAVALAEGDFVQPEDLPASLCRQAKNRNGESPSEASPLAYKEAKNKKLAEFDRDYLRALLARHKGNASRAAEEAGIDRKTIHRMLAKLGLAREDLAEKQVSRA
ncbi:MAG: sigma-54-dependent Fis family transcriptional regulator [Elusimicrobia bacterium]|nr:sigma-54-dependent Fis family transcriptional regulator [Elusimicrobiota bacterium]